jgi:hypothetical protein
MSWRGARIDHVTGVGPVRIPSCLNPCGQLVFPESDRPLAVVLPLRFGSFPCQGKTDYTSEIR